MFYLIYHSEMGKIQATARKPLINKFVGQLAEGDTYSFSNLIVVPNLGTYRATDHQFKLVFTFKTVVSLCVIPSIPKYGISCIPFNKILESNEEFDYLIDVVGLMTAVGSVKEYEREGKTSKMVVCELTAQNMKLELTLFGDYVEQLMNMNFKSELQLPILVIQLAKVRIFRGKIGIQNVMFASKLLLNPDDPEVNSFRNSISTAGINPSQIVIKLKDGPNMSVEEDFMKLTPRSCIEKLIENEEDGTFVIFGTIKAIVQDDPWWYGACKCGRTCKIQLDMFRCDFCDAYLFNITPRFRVKLEVEDASGVGVFVLFERDCTYLMGKNCYDFFIEHMKSSKSIEQCEYPVIFNEIVGKKMLFKIETRKITNTKYYGTFRVKRICDDSNIIAMFELEGSNLTPLKDTFTPPFTGTVDLTSDLDPFPTGTGVTMKSQLELIPSGGSADCEIIGTCDGIAFTPVKRSLEKAFDEADSVVKKSKKVDVSDEVD